MYKNAMREERGVEMHLFEQNVDLLKECVLEEEERYEKLDEIQYSEQDIFEKKGILYCMESGVELQLESRNTEEEMKLYFKDIDWNKENLLFVLGMGNRNLLRAIMKKANSSTKVVIYEPNDKMLKYILEHEDLSEILVPGQVVVWWENNREKSKRNFAYDIVNLNWVKLVYNIHVITCPAYHSYMKKFKDEFLQAKTKMRQYFNSLGNSLEDVLQGFQQNAENVIAGMKANNIYELYDKYKEHPAIIVSAGPSLEKNIDILKDAQEKALIIACDASWTACKQHGVKPDAVATIERGIETYQYYYEGKSFDEDLVLIAPSLIWSQIYEEFPGKTVVVSKNDEGVDGWWQHFFDNVNFINTGMSCSTLAYAAAELAGCNPIILIGQDLAYTDNRKHSSFTHTEFEGENNAEESDGLLVEDIYGNMIPTDKYYNLFRYWFEDKAHYNPEIQLIDATEGGAKIKGSTILTLREAIDTYCKEKIGININECLADNEITKDDVENKKQEILKGADQMIRKLYKTKRKAEGHYKTLEKLYDRIDDDMPRNQLINVVKQMQKGDQIISYMINQKDTITFFQQYIAQTITYVKALGNELTPANVLKNLYAQGNLMGAVKRACVMLIQECEDLEETVQRECDEFIQGEE